MQWDGAADAELRGLRVGASLGVCESRPRNPT